MVSFIDISIILNGLIDHLCYKNAYIPYILSTIIIFFWLMVKAKRSSTENACCALAVGL